MKMIYTIGFCVVLLSISARVRAATNLNWTAEHSTVVRRDRKGVIQIHVIALVQPGNPAKELVRALRHYPHANKFRVSWGQPIFGHYLAGTSLYIRKKKLLALFMIDSDEYADINVYKRYFSVTDNVLQRLKQHNEIVDNDLDNGFGNLTSFGGKIVVSYTKKTLRKKGKK